MGEDERKRYEAIQRANIERMRDRKQWERYKEVLGKDNAPKTLSAFRAIKKANGKKWELLRGYYLGVKKS